MPESIWNEENIEKLKSMWGKEPFLSNIAKKFGISRYKLTRDAQKLGLPSYLEAREEFIASVIKEMWNKEHSLVQIENILKLNRKTITHRAIEMGLSSKEAKTNPKFTPEKVEKLKEMYGKYSFRHISKVLGISDSQLRLKAEKLGLYKPKKRYVKNIEKQKAVIDPERYSAGALPLPAFHPISWGVLMWISENPDIYYTSFDK